MMGILLTALFSMEGSVLGRFRKSMQREDHIYALKNLIFSLTQSGADLQKKQESKLDNGTLTLSTEPVKKGSVLARFEGLQQQKIMSVWQDEKKERSLELIGYVFTPKPEEASNFAKATSDKSPQERGKQQ